MGQTNCQRVQRQRLHQRTIFAGASIVIFNQASRHVTGAFIDNSGLVTSTCGTSTGAIAVGTVLPPSRLLNRSNKNNGIRSLPRRVWVSNNLAFSVAVFAGPVVRSSQQLTCFEMRKTSLPVCQYVCLSVCLCISILYIYICIQCLYTDVCYMYVYIYTPIINMYTNICILYTI